MTRIVLTIFVDCILCILAVFIILPHQPAEATSEEIVAPGAITITAEWPPGDIDIDLWMQAPGDVPVGYSNKGGTVFNLLRDDLGNSNDLTPVNLEFGFSRGMPDGEYTVNVHLFSSHGNPTPVPVHIVISMSTGKKYVVLFDRRVILEYQGHEITVQRWTLEDTVLVGKSLIPRKLRSVSTGRAPGTYGG